MLRIHSRFSDSPLAVAALAGAVLIASGLIASGASAVTFSDSGTFATPQWSETLLGHGDVVDTREATGGNPDAYLRLETIPNGGTIIHGAYLNSAATWDPSTQGAIATIDMFIDVILLNRQHTGFFDGQAYGIALQQNGQIFRSGYPVTGVQTIWDSRSILGQTAASFSLVNPDGTSNNTVDPDFSATGSTITFGLLIANSGGAPISGTTAGYDNWSLTVNAASVAEPGAFGLLGIGLAGFAVAAQRRRKA